MMITIWSLVYLSYISAASVVLQKMTFFTIFFHHQCTLCIPWKFTGLISNYYYFQFPQSILLISCLHPLYWHKIKVKYIPYATYASYIVHLRWFTSSSSLSLKLPEQTTKIYHPLLCYCIQCIQWRILRRIKAKACKIIPIFAKLWIEKYLNILFFLTSSHKILINA